MSRKQARDWLFKLTFELCFQEQSDILFDEFLEDERLDEKNKDFVKDLYSGIIEEKGLLMDDIAKYLKGYTLERVFKVDLAILIIAFYEIKHNISDAKLATNEAVELAKKYSTPKSYSFINGVIASYLKDEAK